MKEQKIIDDIFWKEIADLFLLADKPLQTLKQRAEDFYPVVYMFQQLLAHNENASSEKALMAESFAYGVLQSGEIHRQWLADNKQKVSLHREKEKPILLERKGNTLQLTLNRPAYRNAYSSLMRDHFYEALQLLDADPSIALCEISAIGDCFCVGGDLSEFGLVTDTAEAYRIRQQRNVAGLMLQNRDRITCYVHRACIGSGIELSACAGRLLAREDAFFQLPELNMGLIPGAGGTVSVLRRIGRVRLLWWILTGKKIKARTALEWGLIDAIYC